MYFLGALTVLLLSSCLNPTTYTKQLPAEIVLDDALPPKVVLVSQFDTAQLDFNQNKKNQVFAQAAREQFPFRIE